jgi:hypothetical protein
LLLNLLVNILRISKYKRPFSIVENHELHVEVKVFELVQLLYLEILQGNHEMAEALLFLGFLHGLVNPEEVLKPPIVFFFESLELFLLVVLVKVLDPGTGLESVFDWHVKVQEDQVVGELALLGVFQLVFYHQLEGFLSVARCVNVLYKVQLFQGVGDDKDLEVVVVGH